MSRTGYERVETRGTNGGRGAGGAHRLDPDPDPDTDSDFERRRFPWVVGLTAVALLAVVAALFAVLASRGLLPLQGSGAEAPAPAVPVAPAVPQAPDGAVQGEAGGGAPSVATGRVAVDDTNLLELPPEAVLAAYSGQLVSGGDVVVQSVTPMGFWAGQGASNRVFVQLPLTPGAPVAPGQRVNFEGRLFPVPVDLREQLGVADPQAARQLRAQGQYVQAAVVSPAPAVSPGSTSGTLTAGDQALLPAVPADLRPLVGRPVQATGVFVESVVSDEGFWIGDPVNRAFVRLNVGGESPEQIRPGQRVDLAGTVLANSPDLAVVLGVTVPEGADQLAGQGAHIEAVEVSRTNP